MKFITCQCGEKLEKTSDFLYCESCDHCISFESTCPDCGSATYFHNDPGYGLDTSYCLNSGRFISNITLSWEDMNDPGTDRYQTCTQIIKENKEREERYLRMKEESLKPTPKQDDSISNNECIFCLLADGKDGICPMCDK